MKKRRRVLALFISIFLRNRSLSDARWFYSKKRRIGKGNHFCQLPPVNNSQHIFMFLRKLWHVSSVITSECLHDEKLWKCIFISHHFSISIRTVIIRLKHPKYEILILLKFDNLTFQYSHPCDILIWLTISNIFILEFMLDASRL